MIRVSDPSLTSETRGVSTDPLDFAGARAQAASVGSQTQSSTAGNGGSVQPSVQQGSTPSPGGSIQDSPPLLPPAGILAKVARLQITCVAIANVAASTELVSVSVTLYTSC